jgi:alpha-D-ribose 1-methylphosphonate 5-triphosphate synthase subunit PhnI
VPVEVDVPELGFGVEVGEVMLTECETVNQFAGSATEPAQFTRGYGLVFGHSERKAISMALVDRALRAGEMGEAEGGLAPVQDAQFVLGHADNIQASGFLEHIKLPHYVDFQSELELVRRLRAEAARSGAEGAGGADGASEGAGPDDRTATGDGDGGLPGEDGVGEAAE